jgi:hypothetical protein
MSRQLTALIVTAGLVVGALAFSATAEDRGATERGGGATLTQRVTTLEESAERQRRAIETLREDLRAQHRQIRKLLRFREQANERIAVLERRASKLTGRGVYAGPVDNGQVQLGNDPASCQGQVAEWNAAGTSLGCVPPAP